MIAKEKLTLTRRELQEIVILTSKLITQVGIILTSKTNHLFSSFGINSALIYKFSTKLNKIIPLIIWSSQLRNFTRLMT